MGDEWEGLRAVFGELGTDEKIAASTPAEVAERAVVLAENAARELVAMCQGDSALLGEVLSTLGPDDPAAWMIVSQARKSC